MQGYNFIYELGVYFGRELKLTPGGVINHVQHLAWIIWV